MTRIVFEIEMVVEIKTVDFHKFNFFSSLLNKQDLICWERGSATFHVLFVFSACYTFACYAFVQHCLLQSVALLPVTLLPVQFTLLPVTMQHFLLLQFVTPLPGTLLPVTVFSASLLHLHENLTWVGPIDTHVFIWYFNLNLKQSLL